MDIAYAIALMRGWIGRRQDKGMAVSADAIWHRINGKWAHADEWQRERVFQGCST